MSSQPLSEREHIVCHITRFGAGGPEHLYPVAESSEQTFETRLPRRAAQVEGAEHNREPESR